MKKILLLNFIILIVFASCKSDEVTVIRAFYYWRSDFYVDNNQEELIENLGVKELYLKYFDVVWKNGQGVPNAVVNKTSYTDLIIKPVVYITTEVITNSDSLSLIKLADNISQKIKSIHGERELYEVQIDCDWTASIKEKYFFLLENLKDHFSEVTISATIRLYQYKYPDIAGVPPVDKGLLMYYNMGDLLGYEETNSILNNQLGNQYLGFNKYPLPIDIALPNFKWSLLFREGKFQQICPDFAEEDLNNSELFRKNNEFFTFMTDTVIDGVYFRFGDQLRYENCQEDELLEAASLLVNEINQKETRIIFYDLQPNTYRDYEKLDAVFNIFE